MSKELEKIREKYSKALRDGDTDKATDYYWKAQELKEESEETEEEEVRRDLVYAEEFDGIGEETSEELYEKYGDYPDFVDQVTKEGLLDVSGIGEVRAETILEEVEE